MSFDDVIYRGKRVVVPVHEASHDGANIWSTRWNCKMQAREALAFEGEQYLGLINYYSKYVEVTKLKDLTSLETIGVLKEHVSRHGIPVKLVTDCGV